MSWRVEFELHQAVCVEAELGEFVAPVTVFSRKHGVYGLANGRQAADMGIKSRNLVRASVAIQFGGGQLDFGILGWIGDHRLMGAARSLDGKCPTFPAPCHGSGRGRDRGR